MQLFGLSFILFLLMWSDGNGCEQVLFGDEFYQEIDYEKFSEHFSFIQHFDRRQPTIIRNADEMTVETSIQRFNLLSKSRKTKR